MNGIWNLFAANTKMSKQEMPLPDRELFSELRNDRTLGSKFSGVPLEKFLISSGVE